jgi:hypothetical protein
MSLLLPRLEHQDHQLHASSSQSDTDSKSRREPLSALNNDSCPARRQTRNTRSQVQNFEHTSAPACMSPSESRTTSLANLTSTLPTQGRLAAAPDRTRTQTRSQTFRTSSLPCPTAARMDACEEPSYNLIRRTTRTYLEEEDVEPDTGSSDSGRTCRRRRGTTSPLCDRGGLPLLARQEGCFAARRGPLCWQGQRASLCIHGPYREVSGYNSLRWTDRRGCGSSWTGRLGPRHLAAQRALLCSRA